MVAREDVWGTESQTAGEGEEERGREGKKREAKAQQHDVTKQCSVRSRRRLNSCTD